MGAGDWLMAAGEARHVHEKFGKPVVIVDGHHRPQWIDLWDGLPYILPRATRGTIEVVSGPGVRPYIHSKGPTRWKWKKYAPKPAEMRFTLDEQRFALPFAGRVMIEPNVKAIGHLNKAWYWDRWQQLADKLRDDGVDLVQCIGPLSERMLAGVEVVQTRTFRQALAVLERCRALVTTEGGLMHGAAAVETPAVVLWSEFISPEITGYAMHRNLRHAGPPCGMRLNCSGCRASMAAITVDEIVENLKEILCPTPA